MRGDVVKLKLRNGRMLNVPDDWGMVHDPTGTCINRCDVYLTRYVIKNPVVTQMEPKFASIARAYFGDLKNLVAGSVELPRGPWHLIGQVERIFYARYGNLEGMYYHPFKLPVDLHEQQGGGAYLLSLPERCVIDSHGFVWP